MSLRHTDDGDVNDDDFDVDTTSGTFSFIDSAVVPETLNSNTSDEVSDSNIIHTPSVPLLKPSPSTSQNEREIESLSISDIGKDNIDDSDCLNQRTSSTTCNEKQRGKARKAIKLKQQC